MFKISAQYIEGSRTRFSRSLSGLVVVESVLVPIFSYNYDLCNRSDLSKFNTMDFDACKILYFLYLIWFD
jgi:hypothetical protein